MCVSPISWEGLQPTKFVPSDNVKGCIINNQNNTSNIVLGKNKLISMGNTDMDITDFKKSKVDVHIF